VRSYLRSAAVVGAFALSTLAITPALAAAPVSQAGANAIMLSVAGNANGSGNATATNDGSTEKKSGQETPPVSVLGGQQLLNLGVLAQEATAGTDGSSAACAGVAGDGGSVANIGDSRCLTPGDQVNATLGNLDLSNLVVVDPDSALGPLTPAQDLLLAPVLGPVTAAINDAVDQAQAQFGDLGLVARLGAVEGRCTAQLGSAQGDAFLADAGIRVVLPDQAPQQDLVLLNLPVHPKPNTHLTTNLSDVLDMILDAISDDLNSSLNGALAPVVTGIDALKASVVAGVRENVESNLAPLEQNLLDITLNRQIRPTQDSIKVRALQLALLPVAQEQLGSPLVDLQIGNAACGPSGRIAAVAAPAAPAEPAAIPTGVSAGYETMPAAYSTPGNDDATNMIVLGAFALLVAGGAGFVTYRRLCG
jgi:hypothetical protein